MHPVPLSRVACTLILLGAFQFACGTEKTAPLPPGLYRITEPEAHRAAEPSVAINPSDPDNLVTSFFHYGTSGNPRTQNYAYASHNGGRTWRSVPSHNPERRAQGDDAVTADAFGTFFHSYISFVGIRQEKPSPAKNGIFVERSSDGGLTWSAPVAVVDHLNTVEPFEDKPFLRADRSEASPHFGNLYISWTHFDSYGSDSPADSTQIHFSVSKDGGRSFAMPVRISDRGGDCLDGDGTVEGAVPAVGVSGEVFVVWAGPDGLVLDRSFDGGVTFGKDRIIADMPGGWDLQVTGIMRANGMPVTGADHSEGPHRGRWYVNWVDARFGDPDVFVMHSDDLGVHWSDPVRVNDDDISNGRNQFFTWMSVDPVDGSVNVVFLDRGPAHDDRATVVLARSIDGGNTFALEDPGLSPFSTNDAVFFGDYTGIDAFGGRVVAVFPHFTSPDDLAISAAVRSYQPGTVTLLLP